MPAASPALGPGAAAAQAMTERALRARSAGARVLVGLVGAGIQRSLTPAMQEAEARAQGLSLDYQLIDLDATRDDAQALPALVAAARDAGMAGLNITYPCKQAVMPLLDALSDEARLMGAVNTLVFRDGRAIGHNTDGSGWRWGFERALAGADLSRVVLLGAGGAGSAIAHSLCRMKAKELVVVDSDGARAEALAVELAKHHAATRCSATTSAAAALQGGGGATGLVHATPTGMDKLPGLPLPVALLRPPLWVSEIVYFPLETALLKAARALGCRVVDGGTMAVGQALGAFEHFTGRQADAARVDAHFRRLVAARKQEA
jgi:shikimate dehydrogenase